jgi:succinate dehydrogenase / fumarate reductase iron-sulfur subunit
MILQIRRTHGWKKYVVTVPEEAYILDALEAAGRQDPSLLFRHSCHHASCGSCGLRVNGRERLACITPLAEYSQADRPVRLEPLWNFPVVGDLVVAFGPFMHRLAKVDMPLIRKEESIHNNPGGQPGMRMENCIECGLCISACPVAGTDQFYVGAAILAAAGRLCEEPRQRDIQSVLQSIDQDHGLWRCHAAFECSEVCPANVDPARLIMWLRGLLIR